VKSRVKRPYRFTLLAIFIGASFVLGAAGIPPATRSAQAKLNPAGIDPEALEKIAHANRRAVVRIETLQYFPSSVAQDVQEVADSPSYIGAAGRSLLFVGVLPFKTLWQGVSIIIHPTELPSSKSVGSGFIVDPSGEVLTAEHVITGADSIKIEVPEVGTFPATTVGVDRDTDLALLQIINDRQIRFDTVSLGDSDELKAGQVVMAMGSPFGLQLSVSAGVVSAVGLLGADDRNSDLIQHDAGINPGSSGGPLFDLDGKVIGINSSIASRGQDIGFAIPIDTARAALNDLRHGVKHSRAYLGIAFEPISAETMNAYHLKSNQGARLSKIDGDSPASKVGLKEGDVVLSFANKPVQAPEDLFRAINRAAPETPLKIEILRGAQTKQLNITPIARPQVRSLW
jgi:serine protease Do